uniref:Uncharacterized protein n=1 Tax=Takifugu rubripes TaxID=31033 RepID=A0A3B5KGC0_TAKRU
MLSLFCSLPDGISVCFSNILDANEGDQPQVVNSGKSLRIKVIHDQQKVSDSVILFKQLECVRGPKCFPSPPPHLCLVCFSCVFILRLCGAASRLSPIRRSTHT